MKRREFLKKMTTGITGAAVTGFALDAQAVDKTNDELVEQIKSYIDVCVTKNSTDEAIKSAGSKYGNVRYQQYAPDYIVGQESFENILDYLQGEEFKNKEVYISGSILRGKANLSVEVRDTKNVKEFKYALFTSNTWLLRGGKLDVNGNKYKELTSNFEKFQSEVRTRIEEVHKTAEEIQQRANKTAEEIQQRAKESPADRRQRLGRLLDD